MSKISAFLAWSDDPYEANIAGDVDGVWRNMTSKFFRHQLVRVVNMN